jgi:hypothetical protein
MMRCLRPCQQVVGVEEYRTEVDRVVHFLSTNGRSLLEPLAAARDRLSEEMNFEEAQRQHARYQRIEQVLRVRDELATDVDQLRGVAVAPSLTAGCVELRFLLNGIWLAPLDFHVAPEGGDMVPLDRRLREVAASLKPPRATSKDRAEHLSLLSRWYYSSFRASRHDAEWISFPSLEHLPYRRLVRTISKLALEHAAAFRCPLS